MLTIGEVLRKNQKLKMHPKIRIFKNNCWLEKVGHCVLPFFYIRFNCWNSYGG